MNLELINKNFSFVKTIFAGKSNLFKKKGN
jgi:hypothetical protein